MTEADWRSSTSVKRLIGHACGLCYGLLSKAKGRCSESAGEVQEKSERSALIWQGIEKSDGVGISELTIATTLRKYGIRPTTVRIGPEVSKGYKWEDLREALDHYVPKQEVDRKLQELHAVNDLACEAQKEKEALEAAKVAQEAVDGQNEAEAGSVLI